MQAEPDIVGFPLEPQLRGWLNDIETALTFNSVPIDMVLLVCMNNSDCATTIPIGISAIVAIAIMIFLFLDIFCI